MGFGKRWSLGALIAVIGVGAALSAPPAWSQAADADKKVTVNLKDIPLRAAIDALFAGTGYQYSVNPDVQNVPVNLNIRDVGLQAALRLLVRQAATAQPGLTFSKDGDIFVVKIRRETTTPVATEEAPPEYTDEESEFTWEKIPIQFNNAAVFVLAFGGTMLPTEADVLMGGMGGMGGGMMGGMGGMGGGMGGGLGNFGGGGGMGGGRRF
jgi:type II secretory pathway component GspD/PulD (secretin)